MANHPSGIEHDGAPVPPPVPPPYTPPQENLSHAQTHFATIVRETWSEYIQFLTLGMAAAGFTVVAVAQYLGGLDAPLEGIGIYVKSAVAFAGLAGVSFALCRWLCQLLMERQVYGPRAQAEAYFAASETRAPNALRYSVKTLGRMYLMNDIFKFIGAGSLLLSWVSIVAVLFLQVDLAS